VDADILFLARTLPRDRYKVTVIPTAKGFGAPEQTLAKLRALGVAVDTAPFELSFEDTIAYLVRKLPGADLVVSFQDVADLYPALDRLALRPPLIERGSSVDEALSGPKHLTARYAAVTPEVRDAAASRLPDRPQHSVEIPVSAEQTEDNGAGAANPLILTWERLFTQVLAEVTPALGPEVFQTFIQGGWECSTHVRYDGRRLDVIAATEHDAHAEADYRQLAK
jgi:hypothetical protein